MDEVPWDLLTPEEWLHVITMALKELDKIETFFIKLDLSSNEDLVKELAAQRDLGYRLIKIRDIVLPDPDA